MSDDRGVPFEASDAKIGDVVIMLSLEDKKQNFCGVYTAMTMEPRTITLTLKGESVVFNESGSGSDEHYKPEENKLGLSGIYYSYGPLENDNEPVQGVGDLNPSVMTDYNGEDFNIPDDDAYFVPGTAVRDVVVLVAHHPYKARGPSICGVFESFTRQPPTITIRPTGQEAVVFNANPLGSEDYWEVTENTLGLSGLYWMHGPSAFKLTQGVGPLNKEAEDAYLRFRTYTNKAADFNDTCEGDDEAEGDDEDQERHVAMNEIVEEDEGDQEDGEGDENYIAMNGAIAEIEEEGDDQTD